MADLPSGASDVNNQNDTVQSGVRGGEAMGKERVEAGKGRQEKTPITEYTRKVDLEPEVEGWLEKMEKEDADLGQPVVDDQGQVVLDDIKEEKGKFKIVLPLSKEEVKEELHHKVVDSVRWLAEWCVRMIKMFGSKVAFKREKG